jgi:hypothetical protein
VKPFSKMLFATAALTVSFASIGQVGIPQVPSMRDVSDIDAYKAYVNAMHGYLATLPNMSFPANSFKSAALNESKGHSSSIVNGLRSWEGLGALTLVKSNSTDGKALVLKQLQNMHTGATNGKVATFQQTYILFGQDDRCLVADMYAGCQAK